MAVTDEEVQSIQDDTKKIASSKNVGDVVTIDDKSYKVINKENDQTQAIAVAPCDKDGSMLTTLRRQLLLRGHKLLTTKLHI